MGLCGRPNVDDPKGIVVLFDAPEDFKRPFPEGLRLVEVSQLKAFIQGNLWWDKAGVAYEIEPEQTEPARMSLKAQIERRDDEVDSEADANWTRERVGQWERTAREAKMEASMAETAARQASMGAMHEPL